MCRPIENNWLGWHIVGLIVITHCKNHCHVTHLSLLNKSRCMLNSRIFRFNPKSSLKKVRENVTVTIPNRVHAAFLHCHVTWHWRPKTLRPEQTYQNWSSSNNYMMRLESTILYREKSKAHGKMQNEPIVSTVFGEAASSFFTLGERHVHEQTESSKITAWISMTVVSPNRTVSRNIWGKQFLFFFVFNFTLELTIYGRFRALSRYDEYEHRDSDGDKWPWTVNNSSYFIHCKN